MKPGQLFLFIRMAVYVFAVPFAAYLGGSFNPDTGMLTIDVNKALDLLWGGGIAAVTFLTGRIAKAWGGAT